MRNNQTKPRQPIDHVRHFAKDGPGWKLGALFVEKLPAILSATGGVGLVLLAAVRLYGH